MAVDKQNAEDSQHPPPTIHALLLAFPTRTHLVPLIQLAKKLAAAAKLPHCSCKFVFTSIVSYHIAGESGGWNAGDGDEDEVGFALRTIAVPDGLPASSPRGQMMTMVEACRNMRAPTLRFLPNLLQSSPRLSIVIADVFVTWAPELASSCGLPLFSLFTASATGGCVQSHAPSLLARNIIPFQESKQQEVVECPGAPLLLPADFPASMRLQDVSHPLLQFTLNIFSCLEVTAGLILNTCLELEVDAVEALRTRCPVYTVGPLFLPLGGAGDLEPPSQKQVGGAAATDECLVWLDTQASASVLYVSFGTLANFSSEQIRELALGLEMSQQPFLWVLHKSFLSGALSEALPEGFLERVKGRCFITSWVPQLEVLKHRSVGGFFSHCGWNSILENITLSGVPMLCWPDKAEQGVNARLLADIWKLGMPFKVGKDCSVSCSEVEAAVRSLMGGEEAQEMRRRGTELKKKVEEAVREGGSSLSNLKALVVAMRSKVL